MPHYFSEKQDSKSILKKITINVLGSNINMLTSSGIFSKDRLDKGTELLINSAIIKQDSKVLDLGCGYGIVGIAIAKNNSSTNVLMSDINERAVKISKKNIRFHKLNNLEVRKSNVFDAIPETFDTILLNPP